MKTFIYILLAAAVGIGGVLWFKNRPNQEGAIDIISIGQSGEIRGAYALKDIIGIDEPYICEFEREDETSEVKGTIYIAPGAKVRGDFNISSSATQKPFESHFIMKEGVAYTWTSLLNVGFEAPVLESSTAGEVVALDEKIEYKCVRTETDASKFELPANVNFQSIPQ